MGSLFAAGVVDSRLRVGSRSAHTRKESSARLICPEGLSPTRSWTAPLSASIGLRRLTLVSRAFFVSKDVQSPPFLSFDACVWVPPSQPPPPKSLCHGVCFLPWKIEPECDRSRLALSVYSHAYPSHRSHIRTAGTAAGLLSCRVDFAFLGA